MELISSNKVFLAEKNLKHAVFLGVTPYSFMDVCQCSGGTDYVLVRGSSRTPKSFGPVYQITR